MSCGNKIKVKVREIAKKADQFVREYAGYALDISSNLKRVLDSPFGDLVTQIIPSTWNEELRTKGIDAFGKAVNILAITKDIANEPDMNKKLKLFIETLSDKSNEFRESQLKKIMDLTTKYMHGARLKDHEYEAIATGTFITTLKSNNKEGE